MSPEHNSPIGYHIVNGAFQFSYVVDRNHAVAHHPNEWSKTPWTAERAAKARAANPDLPAAEPLEPEDQAAVDAHTQAQREAAERLAAFDKAEAERKQVEEQVAADRALLDAPAPAPIKRPFGRKGEPTEKEREMMARRAAEKEDDARRAAEEENQ